MKEKDVVIFGKVLNLQGALYTGLVALFCVIVFFLCSMPLVLKFLKPILMKNLLRLFLFVVCSSLSLCVSAQSTESIRFTFARTGSSGETVTVSAVDAAGTALSGVTANIAVSHAMKTSGTNITSGILCPDVNATTSPTITFQLSVSGLPSDFSFNALGLDIHALNSGGAYQSNSDNKLRQFNVASQFTLSGTTANFSPLADIDIAAGVGAASNVHKMWETRGATQTVADGALTLLLTVTKGTTNNGCFFGLSEIKLFKEEETVSERHIVNFKWKNTSDLYMAEEADGSMVASTYDVTKRIFWELIPTGEENTYFIKNTATGRYIGSCNKTPSSASKISTSVTPVAYYIKETASTASEISGCFYLSSTDCTSYADESASPRALNKDGASSSIITWQAGPNGANYRVGSYWKIIDTEDLYEVRPFVPVAQPGPSAYYYNIVNHLTGQALNMLEDGSVAWQPVSEEEGQTWYFVGQSKHEGGYQIYNAKHGQALQLGETDHWVVFMGDTEAPTYFFRPFGADAAGTCALQVAGDSLVTFRGVRSSFARHNGLYNLPCGGLGTVYVSRVAQSGEAVVVPLSYPLTVLNTSGSGVTTQSAQPGWWYTLFTQSKSTLARGKRFATELQLSAAPAAGTECFAYFDWNGDGVFETSQSVDVAQSMSFETDVPADARLGKTRMRLRLTENGLSGAEDDVLGQTIDFVLNVVDAPAAFTVTVTTNDPSRGTAELVGENRAVATPLGSAVFLCWREGNQVVSTVANYSFELNHDLHLTAVFSPNTDLDTGITSPRDAWNHVVNLQVGKGEISFSGDEACSGFSLYSLDGELVGSTSGRSMKVRHLASGTYIVRIHGAASKKSVKVCVR